MSDHELTRRDIAVARSTALQLCRDPSSVTPAERAFMNQVCEAMSPENFYMDGELFAGDY